MRRAIVLMSDSLLDRHTIAEAPDRFEVMRRPAWVFPFQIGRQPQTYA